MLRGFGASGWNFLSTESLFTFLFTLQLLTLHFSPNSFSPFPYIFYPSFFTLHPSLFSLHPSSIEYYENFCRLHLVNYQLIRIFFDKIMFTTIIFTLYRKVSNLIINCRILDCYIAFPQSITRNLIIFNSPPTSIEGSNTTRLWRKNYFLAFL